MPLLYLTNHANLKGEMMHTNLLSNHDTSTTKSKKKSKGCTHMKNKYLKSANLNGSKIKWRANSGSGRKSANLNGREYVKIGKPRTLEAANLKGFTVVVQFVPKSDIQQRLGL